MAYYGCQTSDQTSGRIEIRDLRPKINTKVAKNERPWSQNAKISRYVYFMKTEHKIDGSHNLKPVYKKRKQRHYYLEKKRQILPSKKMERRKMSVTTDQLSCYYCLMHYFKKEMIVLG